MPTVQDYYQVLGISQETTLTEIKQAFRRLVRQYHPDVNPHNPDAALIFHKICEAYEALSNHHQRDHADQERRNPEHAKTASAPLKNEFIFQHLYQLGVEKAAQRDYQGAIEAYTQSIQLQPKFVDAYLGRCQARYAIRDDRGVLDDCYQALHLNPTLTMAYYYQGRARYRLGYVQAAIESYTSAITLSKAQAKFYYYRGLARLELQERQPAIDDLQHALALYQLEGDRAGSHLAQTKLESLKPSLVGLFCRCILAVPLVLEATARTLCDVSINPKGLTIRFNRMPSTHAAWVGIVLGLIAALCFERWVRLHATNWMTLPLWQQILLGEIPFVCLVSLGLVIGAIGGRCRWQATLFLAGAALTPLSIAALLYSAVATIGAWAIVMLSLIATYYTITILYAGWVQLLHLPKPRVIATLSVSLSFVGGLLYLVF
jgi:tetratricopeptide (TPR) repeat protein